MCIYRVVTVCVADAGLPVGRQYARRQKETQKNKKCQGDEMMGELGDWGYWLLFIIVALVVFVWGYAVGYDEGKKDGIRAKKERHIDAKI